jgi:peptide deformylase
MAILKILEFPDPRLRTVAKPVTDVDETIKRLIADMFDTMKDAQGIGLAASQIDVHLRVIVMDLGEDDIGPRVFINPEIKALDDSVDPYEEGCLSVPGFYEKVDRPAHVMIRALDGEGNAFEEEARGLLAVCIQHEIDHLEGKLFVDYLSPFKRQRIRKKLEKINRQNA